VLLSRYGDMQYILSLSLRHAFKLYNKALKENRRDKAHDMWLAIMPKYTNDTYETFEEFYDRIYPPKVEMDTRSKEEIMDEILGNRKQNKVR